MIKIEVKGDEIQITTSSLAILVMDWQSLKEVEKAIKTIRDLQAHASFTHLDITIP